MTVRLNANVIGLTSGIALAIRAFQNVQSEAARTQSAVQAAFGQQARATNAVTSATTGAESAQIRHTRAVDNHTQAVNRLNKAQSSFSQAQSTYQVRQNQYTMASGLYGAQDPRTLQAAATRDTARQRYATAGSAVATATDAEARASERATIAGNSLSTAHDRQTQATLGLANAKGRYAAASANALVAMQREERMMRGMNQLAIGGIETGVGLGILGVLKTAVKNAMTLDLTQTTIGQALTDKTGRRLPGTTTSGPLGGALSRLSGAEIDLGLKNQMSQNDVANVVKAATQAGMTRMDVLLGTPAHTVGIPGLPGATRLVAATQGILPGLTNFAEVLSMTRGYSPQESTKVGSQFAHLFGAWAPDKFNQMTNLLARALFVSPASPQEFLTLISQFSGTTRGLYGKSAAGQNRFLTDTIRSGLLLTELGQETRGGTQLAQMVSRLAGTGKGASVKGLEELRRASGVTFFNKQGEFTGVPDVIRALFTAYQNEPAKQFARQMHDAFGQVGARIAGNLAQLSTKDRLTVLTTMLGPNGLPQSSAIQKAINASPLSQINQLNANLNTLSTIVGTQLLPALAPFISGLSNGAKTLVELAHAHPTIVRLVGQFAALSSGILLIVGPLTATAGIFNILFGATLNVNRLLIALGVTGAGGVLGGLIVTVGALAVAFGGLYLVVKFINDHWPTGLNKSKVKSPASPGKPSPLLPAGADPHTPIVLPGMGVPPHWVPGYGWRPAGWTPPVVHTPPPPGHTRPGVGGGTRVMPPVHVHVHGVDHETHRGLIQDVTDAALAAINKAMDFDAEYEGLGIHSLSPGNVGY